METKECSSSPQQSQGNEAQTHGKKGGWLTFPFIIGSTLGLALAVSGAQTNLIVYLIKQFNIKSIDAAQISNIVNGCSSIAPLAGAIISDSYSGCFPVIAFSTFAAVLSMVMFTMTAALPSLRPASCPAVMTSCAAPSAGQLAMLYGAVALSCVGNGGTRFATMTMGADQFDHAKDQDVFFNWYFIVLYGASMLGATVIVYVEDGVSWPLGFGLCTAASMAAVVVLLLGMRYYRRPMPQGSPFVVLARVVVAAIKKRKLVEPTESCGYYHGPTTAAAGVKTSSLAPPTRSFSFLNCAAVIADGDTLPDGSLAKPWRLCTVEQVEDPKVVLRIMPLWSASIILSITIGVQASLSVLQALTMDLSIGPRFSIPAGSLIVSSFAGTTLFLAILDRAIYPAWHSLTRRTPTSLQRIGVGHLINIAAMAASALVERERAAVVQRHHATGRQGWTVPMSALWLVLPFVMTGAAEAFHFPGQVALYYQEFPASLKTTATGMIAVIVALGFYLSTAVIDLVRRLTRWLPDNINDSRLENVYWMLVAMAAINFGYYLVCASLYRYQSDPEKVTGAVAQNLDKDSGKNSNSTAS